ncbi:MAG TPA: tRNA (adenosine(37)-N6)-threonylcarbamoyltransferase complex dimerization subunit type 1 TsaB [Streptosporangiaceae bacterium]|nr:tRNA (adenosine(37)-N6)-threonylcarbamoyltransferase complex dimerization subunit type 1 TsaB [Streptosporangiaceae bacterium]
MLLLAFDTATPAVTVALHDGTHVLAETTTVDARRHGELLTPAIDAVLTEAGAGRLDITVVAAGTGPGPYTGLRAGLVTARVLGSALGVPVLGVCTLDVIAGDAVAAAGGREFIVATDARRREVYWARYSAAGERLAGPGVSAPADIGAPGPGGPGSDGPGFDGPGAGAGPLLYPGLLGEPIEPRYPSAATLARLAAGLLAAGAPAAGAEPVYLRRPDARVPGPPKRVTAA